MISHAAARGSRYGRVRNRNAACCTPPPSRVLAMSRDSHAKQDVRNCRGHSYYSTTSVTSEVMVRPWLRYRAFSNKTTEPLHSTPSKAGAPPLYADLHNAPRRSTVSPCGRALIA
jgi:hypothetical protein